MSFVVGSFIVLVVVFVITVERDGEGVGSFCCVKFCFREFCFREFCWRDLFREFYCSSSVVPPYRGARRRGCGEFCCGKLCLREFCFREFYCVSIFWSLQLQC